MKTKILLFAILLSGSALFAQAPEKMSYQAVVRDGSGSLVSNSSVGVRISIIQGSITGSNVYIETHNISSNANGLISLTIGSGTVVGGSIAGIDWSAGPYFMKTDTDPTGGTSYTISGTSQMMSVPYALYAEKSGSGGVTIYNLNGSSSTTPVPTGATEYSFFGPTQNITITAGQKICGCAVAPLATTTGTAVNVRTGLGYKLIGSTDNIANFVGSSYSYIEIDENRTPVTASACKSGLAAGNYVIGYIVYNPSSVAVNSNDYLNGWIMVTD